ncbi:MAG: tRNA dihydrouridine synthase DusB [Planctomycetota bacterium]|nr:MAG: tRNA dihydrouridine synthase DusB [Planctomycetota bacterium]
MTMNSGRVCIADKVKIGHLTVSPPLFQAPMAGFTNFAFRQIVRSFGGCGLPITEMVSARGFLEIDRRGEGYPERLWGVRQEPRPLAVQIWDNDPGQMAEVARRLVDEFAVSTIDINFGCPAKQIAGNVSCGSYLLRFPERIEQIVRRIVETVRPVPVTAKIRLGVDRKNITACEVAQAVEEAGGSALAVHGRTAAQMYRGRADWEAISAVKPYLRRIPLIGNGDLSTPEQIVDALRTYDVDGVMIGRASLSRPWIFRQAAALLAGQSPPPAPSLAEQRDLILAHHRMLMERFGPRRGTVLMRKFACRYAHGKPGAKRFRIEAGSAISPEEFVHVVKRHFSHDA